MPHGQRNIEMRSSKKKKKKNQNYSHLIAIVLYAVLERKVYQIEYLQNGMNQERKKKIK